ncbi:multidrug effflux MFS transporter [Ruixingdingia sedimenti]|uniref:Bcr/CflA family efflux transporter n=1 Tax=Ruixingdingia sedimenti TaxID=3073604 RepID=A0ABU1F5U8_9RHOB|nr:multidrug effflux MFS transporter [Xinfangfangia sp. LG-4]MDR5652249.1 multidrug effflux MFS transporter [Xinfangfangia sp. LG-4]
MPVVRFLDRTTPPHIATLILLTGLSSMSLNVFLPSLPAMAEWFAVPYGTMQLSVTLYLALSAVLQLVVGPLSDRFGRRPVILGTGVVFLLASVGTILAPTIELFLVFRMLQAVIVTGMVLSRAVVRDMVPGPQAASMIGYVTMGMALVPMASPMIGGFLDEILGWQASFGLLAVLGAVVLVLVWADLGETKRPAPGGFGAQLRQYPALFGSMRFWGYTLSGAAGAGVFYTFLGGAPFVGAQVFGLSPAVLGLHFAAPSLGYAVGNFLSGRFAVRFGIDGMVLRGCVVLAVGMGVLAVLTLAGIRHPTLFFGLITLVGVGNGMALPSTNTGMMSVRPELAGSASGLGGAMMIGGGAALTALAGVLLQPGASELPLVLLMFGSAVVSLLAALAVRFSRAEAG